jgi:hypothetical protein
MKGLRIIGIVAAFASFAVPARAQETFITPTDSGSAQEAIITPTDSGRGYKLGIQELNNSGQAGWFQLFSRGSKTVVSITLDGTHARERARLQRAKSCDSAADITPAVFAPLSDVVGGKSTTTVDLPLQRALSGNYAVVVDSPHGGAYFACGHLRQEIGLSPIGDLSAR